MERIGIADVSRSKRSPTRKESIIGTVVVFGALLFLSWLVAGPWLEAHDQQWVRCNVTGAKAQRGDNHATTPFYVVVETSDCGAVTYRIGTNRDNVEAVAEIFEPGPYEFKFGTYSQWSAEGRTLLDPVADAKDFRRLAQ